MNNGYVIVRNRKTVMAFARVDGERAVFWSLKEAREKAGHLRKQFPFDKFGVFELKGVGKI